MLEDGYGRAYEQTALDLLVEKGVYTLESTKYSNGNPKAFWHVIDQHDDKKLVFCSGVSRKKDL
jgi:hypothetical protein